MFDKYINMPELYNILGDMSESERQILMRSALRSKHLRFLDHQRTVQQEQRSAQTTAEQRSPLPPVQPPAKAIVMQPPAVEQPIARPKILPDLNITSSDKVNGVRDTRTAVHIAVNVAPSDTSEQRSEEHTSELQSHFFIS